MGSLCIGGDSNANEGQHSGGMTIERQQLIEKHKQINGQKKLKKLNEKNVNNDSGSESEEDESNDDNNPKYDQLQIETMQKEVIVLSTRNANLEQQLEEMKQKYIALEKEKTADEAEV